MKDLLFEDETYAMGSQDVSVYSVYSVVCLRRKIIEALTNEFCFVD